MQYAEIIELIEEININNDNKIITCPICRTKNEYRKFYPATPIKIYCVVCIDEKDETYIGKKCGHSMCKDCYAKF